MISIKCKITNNIEIDDYLRQYGNVFRFAYNRFFKEKKSISEVYHLCNKKMNNILLLDASFVEFAVMEAHQTWKSQAERKQNKIIFGGRKNFWKIKFHDDNAEELVKNKWLYCIGRSKVFKGNRKFNFNLSNNKVTFKPSRNVKIPIEFLVTSNYRKLLDKAQVLLSVGELPVTIKLSKDYIVFQIDESILCNVKNSRKIIPNRILSIDSNPQFIGVSISDFNKETDSQKVIYTEVFDLRKLAEKSSGKRYYEIYSVAKQIAKIARHYHCEAVGVEKLSIKNKNHGKGRTFNRKVNNLWNRVKFFNNLKKWLNILDIRHQEIVPEYSSLIGQFRFPDETDCVAASLEIARRTYLFNRIFIRKDREKTNIVFPNLQEALDRNPTRWKEMGIDSSCKNWKVLFGLTKKSKLSYRFLFDDWAKAHGRSSFRHKSRSSNVKVIKTYHLW